MMRLFRLMLLTIILASTSIILAQTETASVSLDERGYGLYVPANYSEDGEDQLPLIIALHGFGGTWETFYQATGLTLVADQEQVIVAFPQGYINQWNDGSVGDHSENDVQILRDLVERVDRDYRVDLERVYLVGFSNGGAMVYHAACEAPDLFAGIVSVAGTMRIETARTCSTDLQIPVLMIHSAADLVVPFSGTGARFPVEIAVQVWADRNSCELGNVPQFDETLFQNGFRIYLYDDCPNGNFVMLHALQNEEHVWPGFNDYLSGDFPDEPHLDTARLIWGFFEISYQARLEAATNPEITPEATESTDE